MAEVDALKQAHAKKYWAFISYATKTKSGPLGYTRPWTLPRAAATR